MDEETLWRLSPNWSRGTFASEGGLIASNVSIHSWSETLSSNVQMYLARFAKSGATDSKYPCLQVGSEHAAAGIPNANARSARNGSSICWNSVLQVVGPPRAFPRRTTSVCAGSEVPVMTARGAGAAGCRGCGCWVSDAVTPVALALEPAASWAGAVPSGGWSVESRRPAAGSASAAGAAAVRAARSQHALFGCLVWNLGVCKGTGTARLRVARQTRRVPGRSLREAAIFGYV